MHACGSYVRSHLMRTPPGSTRFFYKGSQILLPVICLSTLLLSNSNYELRRCSKKGIKRIRRHCTSAWEINSRSARPSHWWRFRAASEYFRHRRCSCKSERRIFARESRINGPRLSGRRDGGGDCARHNWWSLRRVRYWGEQRRRRYLWVPWVSEQQLPTIHGMNRAASEVFWKIFGTLGVNTVF